MRTGNRRRFDLAKQGNAILKRAGCDTMSGAKKTRRYRRNKQAQSKITTENSRERNRKLGKLGAASPVRYIDPAMRE